MVDGVLGSTLWKWLFSVIVKKNIPGTGIKTLSKDAPLSFEEKKDHVGHVTQKLATTCLLRLMACRPFSCLTS